MARNAAVTPAGTPAGTPAEAAAEDRAADPAADPAADRRAAARAAVEEAVTARLAELDLDAKTRILSGRDMWSLPAEPRIGLASVVMSDGPIGVRGLRWTPDDPSVALPSPTALAAAWDPGLARRVGHLLAQEARRKGVHVLLAPTVNLHRTPLGGRHFECYSEDPLLTSEIAVGYITGVQEGGVATTVKHYVANDSETDRMSVDVRATARTLRELYLAPFEAVVRRAGAWGVMDAYNRVNGPTMTEHAELNNGVLRGEWGFDGFIVSDWTAARDTVAAANGGLDVAMPGPLTVYGEALAQAVREGAVDERVVDDAVRRVLRLAARVGALEDVPAAVRDLPPEQSGSAVAREVAVRSFVLVRNEGGALPLDPAELGSVALIGAAARDARVMGGGSATVFPDHVVSPLDGLRAALPDSVRLTHRVGADPSTELPPAERGFQLRAICRDEEGRVLAEVPLPNGLVQWLGELPEGPAYEELDSVETVGTFTPAVGGPHRFGVGGVGPFRLTVAGKTLYDGDQAPLLEDPLSALHAYPPEELPIDLVAGEPVEVSLHHTVVPADFPIPFVCFSLAHAEPERDPETAIEEAVAAAREADAAVVVVATTSTVESEGHDRTSLKLPGRQDELVARVAAVNPRTVVVVNSGSPVEMPWLDEVPSVLLGWFPGQECGAALADVLLGEAEPGGRLPTTWPVRMEDCPVLSTEPVDGELPYDEGVFIGYRAWERGGTAPAFWFGHGLGYTAWEYESASWAPYKGDKAEGDEAEVDEAQGAEEEADEAQGAEAEALGTVTVRVRNTGRRVGREVVQVYLAPAEGDENRPRRVLAGFAAVTAEPGESAEATVTVPLRCARIWDDGWRTVPGPYRVEVGRSYADLRLGVDFDVRP
ncbi:beta-glucosidase family protein [Wenjunlia tyrosinilytica]|uniref:Beta-glucosidase n=1 Tax=Wenjunlia tyrosinilytica TaxID=1544741 RepID=A0A917ZQM2_9ACTN|nr:glycoside hydrolase family 3 C-terminal domain-containing protein [Wenjunlia tyrosinilytica]GGO88932.1 beta-glucosidase [Wenjunlia tyrosinilytica]